LLRCHGGLTSIEEVNSHLNPMVALYIYEFDDPDEALLEFVYTFDLNGEGSKGYFVQLHRWKVIEAFLAG
jgi:hypothetical protein